MQAIVRELELRKGELPPGPLQSLYWGGGTPSLLTPEQVESLSEAVHRSTGLAPGAEFTLEANPEDIRPETLAAWRRAGVNRLSIGIQSFDARDLGWMNRAHSPEQALASLRLAQEAGFDNLSLDLIFGLPGRSLGDWQATLKTALSLSPAHLSIYALTVEPRTALNHQVKKGLTEVAPEPLYEAQFMLAHKVLADAGFEHYELSNYALPGRRAVHNSSYWQGAPYLGLGPSAHSYDGAARRWNLRNNARYLEAIAADRNAIEAEEVLSPRDRLNERLMTGLRHMSGVDLQELASMGRNVAQLHERELGEWEQQGWLWRQGSRIGLTPRGWLRSDGLISALFWVEA